MYKQVINYVHACRLTTGNYTIIIVSQATPSLRRVWLARLLTLAVYIMFICATVSYYYRETCFKQGTCADFSISDSGDYIQNQFPDW